MEMGRGRKTGGWKGKEVVSQSSHTKAPGNEGKEDEDKRFYSLVECDAVAKAWSWIMDDPIAGNKKTLKGLWARVRDSYEICKPKGAKVHTPDELRKTWDRIRKVVSRFTGNYENNVHPRTSGQTMEDIKELSLSQYPEDGRYPQFKYWESFMVLKDSPKFQQEMDEGFPKRMRLVVSGNYNSIDGSVNPTEVVDEVPPPAPRL